jgi:hypothetical protein
MNWEMISTAIDKPNQTPARRATVFAARAWQQNLVHEAVVQLQ